MRPFDLNSLLPKRLRILWMVLGAMLLVSLLPIWLYHQQVLKLSQQKLEDTEQIQQTELTHSVADQILLFKSTIQQQLISERQILALTGLIDDVNTPVNVPKVTHLLENFASGNPNILYVTAVGTDLKGSGAGDFSASQDPFVGNALKSAFMTTEKLSENTSDPPALHPGNR